MFVPASLLRKKKQISKNNSKEKITKDIKKSIEINSISKIELNKDIKKASVINTQINLPKEDNIKDDIVQDKKKSSTIEDENSDSFTVQKVANDELSENRIENEKVNNEKEEEEEEEEYKVKEFSFQQRWPLDDMEPICIICGRYGEYICDETDHDVCSMECKKLDIQNSKISKDESSYLANKNLFNSNEKPVEIPLAIDNISFPIQKILFDSSILVNSNNLEEFLEKKSIDIKKIPENLDIPNPIQKFESLNLNSQLFQNLKKNRYHKPTNIQMLAIPLLLKGNDMLVKSPMKSGKTLAYLLPLIIHSLNMIECFIELEGISKNYNTKINSNTELQNFRNYSMPNKNFGPYAIILTPSKELCIQLESLCKKLLMGIPYMKTALLIGGAPYPNQLYRLRSGVQIIIATPSRLLEILKKSENDSEVLELEFKGKKSRNNNRKNSSINYLSWDLVSYIVVDEIDQIINYGEVETLQNIFDRLKTLSRSNHYNKTSMVTPNENNYLQLNKRKNKDLLIHSIQVSLFSSTIPTKIIPLCKKFLNSSFITISAKDETEIATSLSESLHLTSNKNENLNTVVNINKNTNSLSNPNSNLNSNISPNLSTSLVSNINSNEISNSVSNSLSNSPSISPIPSSSSIVEPKHIIPNLVYPRPRPIMNINQNPVLNKQTNYNNHNNSTYNSNFKENDSINNIYDDSNININSSNDNNGPPGVGININQSQVIPKTYPLTPNNNDTINNNDNKNYNFNNYQFKNIQPPSLNFTLRPRPMIPLNTNINGKFNSNFNSSFNTFSQSIPGMPISSPMSMSMPRPRPGPPIQMIQRPPMTSVSSAPSPSPSPSPSTKKRPVKQTFMWVEDNSKKKELFKLLMDSRYFQPLIVIFVDSRLGAELLTKAIQKKTGLGVACVHGQKSVEERMKILDQFKLGGPYPIIVSTSGILGRGVQLEDVRMVIQFDCASTVEDYIHQVGRCAIPVGLNSNSNLTRKTASHYFPKGNKHFRTGHPWLGGTGGWAITFINKTNLPVLQKLYHQYLKNLSSSELTPLPQQLLQQVKK